MLQAWREGLTRGDYAFFYIDIFGASLQGSHFPEPQRPWKRGDRDDASARQAFEVSTLGCCTRAGTPACVLFSPHASAGAAPASPARPLPAGSPGGGRKRD